VSAPPLPEIFGNYVLGDEFVEVVAPAAVNWLPQTAAWAWLGAALGVLLLRLAWRRLRRWHRNRYRREAAARLQALAAAPRDGDWLGEVNRLLKLTALAAFPRERVARLHGRDWVEFLNSRCAAAPFSAAQQDLLAAGVYARATPAEPARRALLGACRQWIECHEGPGYYEGPGGV